MNKQKRIWILDAALYVGFLVSMLLDLTGLEVHQWLGIAIVALAGHHLVLHGQWVVAITGRFFGRASGRTRGLYLVDAGLMAGFLAIGATGLAMSTWLELPLADYAAWHDWHVIVSVATLGLVLVKIGLHWRWIMGTATRHVFVEPMPVMQRVGSPQPAAGASRMGRREFLGLMGLAGAAAISASSSALSDLVVGRASAAANDESAPAPAGKSVAQAEARVTDPKPSSPSEAGSTTLGGSSSTGACVVRCSKRCSYPGKCRKYVDANANKRCDLGECTQ